MKITINDIAEHGSISAAIEARCSESDTIASGVIGSSFATSGPGSGYQHNYDATDYAERALAGDYGASSYIDSYDGREATMQELSLMEDGSKCIDEGETLLVLVELEDDTWAIERQEKGGDPSPEVVSYHDTEANGLAELMSMLTVEWSDESVIELECPSLSEALEDRASYEIMLAGLSTYDGVTDPGPWNDLQELVDSQEKVDEVKRAKAEAGPDAYLWLHDSGDCILWPDEESSEDDNGSNAIERWTLTPAECRALKADHDDETLVDYFA